jgi:hypothetical protein
MCVYLRPGEHVTADHAWECAVKVHCIHGPVLELAAQRTCEHAPGARSGVSGGRHANDLHGSMQPAVGIAVPRVVGRQHDLPKPGVRQCFCDDTKQDCDALMKLSCKMDDGLKLCVVHTASKLKFIVPPGYGVLALLASSAGQHAPSLDMTTRTVFARIFMSSHIDLLLT